MNRRTALVVFVAIAVACSLVPAGGVVADPMDDTAAEISTGGIDISITDRFRYRTASSGLARTDPDGVLEQSTRKSVYNSIRASPGIGLDELVAAVSVTRSTVRYHARVLRKAGLIGSTTVAGTLRFAPTETDVELAGTLSATPTRVIIDAVSEHEPASVTSIAEATERAPSTVSHHLSALEERGIVDRERAGEAVLTTLTAGTRSAMESPDAPVSADD